MVSLAAAAIIIAATVAATRALVGARLGQPRVVVELVVGILVGLCCAPLIAAARGFSTAIHGDLSSIGQIALFAYMFSIGSETDAASMRAHYSSALVVALCAVLVPFVATLVILQSRVGWLTGVPNSHGLASFAIAGAVSVTALPVMIRLLHERQRLQSRVGTVALSAAAFEDIASWMLLAILLEVAGIGGRHGQVALFGGALCAGLIGVAFWKRKFTIPAVVIASIVSVLYSIETPIVMFLAGMLITRDRDSGAVLQILRRISSALLSVLFLVAGISAWGSPAITLVPVAFWILWGCATKGGSAFLAARATGLPSRSSFLVASLMNCRGVVSLVFLSVALQNGLIDRETYTILLFVSIVLTVLCAPLLALAQRLRGHAASDGWDGRGSEVVPLRSAA